jgi:hypothetical protein
MLKFQVLILISYLVWMKKVLIMRFKFISKRKKFKVDRTNVLPLKEPGADVSHCLTHIGHNFIQH